MSEEKKCTKCGLQKDGTHASYCRDCYNQYKRDWYSRNREKEVKRCMDYNYKHYEEFKCRLRGYRKKPEWQEKFKEWRSSNPERVRGYDAKKRAKREEAEGEYGASDVYAILDRQNNKCAEPTCGKDLTEGYHVDHIMPLALGGSNWPSNLQCLCPACNMSKGAKHPIDWAKSKGRLV